MSLFTIEDFELAVEVQLTLNTTAEVVDIIINHEGARPTKIVLTCDALGDRGGYEGFIILAFVGPTLMTYYALKNEMSEWFYADATICESLIGNLQARTAILTDDHTHEVVQALRLILLNRHNQRATNEEHILAWFVQQANTRYEQTVLSPMRRGAKRRSRIPVG